jgi:hypothetical protein
MVCTGYRIGVDFAPFARTKVDLEYSARASAVLLDKRLFVAALRSALSSNQIRMQGVEGHVDFIPKSIAPGNRHLPPRIKLLYESSGVTGLDVDGK